MWMTKKKLEMLEIKLRGELVDYMQRQAREHSDLVREFTKWQVSVNNELKDANLKLTEEINGWQDAFTKDMDTKTDKMYAQLNEHIDAERKNREAAREHDKRHHKLVEGFVEGIHDSLVQKNAPDISKLRIIAEAALQLVRNYEKPLDPNDWDTLADALELAGYDTGYSSVREVK